MAKTNKIKSRKSLIGRIVGILSLCAVLVAGVVFAFPIHSENKAEAADFTVDEITIDGYETSSSSKKFNAEVLATLYQKIMNNANATFDDVKAAVAGDTNWTQVSGMTGTNNLANNPSAYKVPKFLTSRQLNGNAVLCVKFGGLTWVVTYVTRDADNNVIATLMLKDPNELTVKQSAWCEGNWYSSSYTGANHKYPINMYSSSYVRMYTLNAGNPDGSATHYSSYANATGYDSLNGTVTATQRANNQFAKFTLSGATGSLIDFITKPEKVRYQGIQSWSYLDRIQANNTGNCNLHNEAYEATTVVDRWIVGNYMTAAQSKAYCADWKNDYLWLPSLTEVGANGKTYSEKSGVWCTQNSVRSSCSNYLSRTGGCGSSYVDYLNLTSNAWGSGNGNYTAAIRPCLHLNLTAADDAAAYPVPTTDIEVEYNGLKQDIPTLAPKWYDPDPSSMTVSEKDGDFINVGTHVHTVELLDDAYSFKGQADTVRKYDINVVIKPKKIKMEAPTVLDTGDLDPDVPIEMSDNINLPYANDKNPDGSFKNTAPEFGLEYKKQGSTVWTRTKPTVAGNYVARPYITNVSTCNYEIDYSQNCETPFTRLKDAVAVPYFNNSSLSAGDIAGSVTTVQYTGDWQEFDLINSAANNNLTGVTIGGRTGGLSYVPATGKFRAKQVGDYTVTVYLADNGANTRWADSATNAAATRVITLKITKRQLSVTFEDDTVTSWSNGARTDIKVNVSGVVNNEAVKLHVYYTKNGANPVDITDDAMTQSGSDIDVVVDLSRFESEVNYQLCVELASGVTVNNNYTIVNNTTSKFTFFILKATISSLDIEWQYDNPKTGTNLATTCENITAMSGNTSLAGPALDYNGQDYTFKLNEGKLPSGLSVTYTNNVQSDVLTLVNGGPFYTSTATIAAESGYELETGIPTSYTVVWQIKALLFDLADLKWADNPEFNNNARVYMYLLDDPVGLIKQSADATLPPVYGTYTAGGWLEVENTADFVCQNYQLYVGQNYTAGYLLTCDDNHEFADWTGDPAGTGTDGITLITQTSALVSHVWEVTPIRIKTSTKNADWSTSEEYWDDDFDYFLVPQANVMQAGSPYAGVLQVTYYDEEMNPVADIEAIDVTPGQIDIYYAKLEVAPEAAGNYQLFDTVYNQVKTEILKSFSVGDRRTGVPVNYGPTSYIYNGEPQGQVPTITMTAPIAYEVFALNEETGLYESMGMDFPTDVGSYYIEVKFDDPVYDYDEDFRLDPSRHYYTIDQLVLKTDDWTTGEGNQAPVEKVIADTLYNGGSDYSDLYGEVEIYEVLDDGTRVLADKDNLAYETNYVAVLKVRSDCEHNVTFDGSAQTEFPFTTGFDPDNIIFELPDPVVEADTLPYSGQEQTFVISNWNAIKDHVTVERDDGATGEAAFRATTVGTYKLTLKLRTDENVTWLNEGDIDWELEFEITVREIARPTFRFVEFNGAEFDIYELLPEESRGWVTVEIIAFHPYANGTQADTDEAGHIIVRRAGVYALRFTLSDPDNTEWAAPAQGENVSVGFRVALLAGGGTDAIETDLEVHKAVIKGSWDEEGNFIPEDSANEGKYQIKYIDEDGNVVEPEDFEDGKIYRAVATLNDEFLNDYEFGEEIRKSAQEPEVSEKSFTKTASTMDRALGFLQKYWIWLVIAVATLLFLILSVLAAAKRKKLADEKEFEDELADEVGIEEEPEEEEAPELVTEEKANTAAGGNGNNNNGNSNGGFDMSSVLAAGMAMAAMNAMGNNANTNANAGAPYAGAPYAASPAPAPYGAAPYAASPAPYGAAPYAASPAPLGAIGADPLVGGAPLGAIGADPLVSGASLGMLGADPLVSDNGGLLGALGADPVVEKRVPLGAIGGSSLALEEDESPEPVGVAKKKKKKQSGLGTISELDDDFDVLDVEDKKRGKGGASGAGTQGSGLGTVGSGNALGTMGASAPATKPAAKQAAQKPAVQQPAAQPAVQHAVQQSAMQQQAMQSAPVIQQDVPHSYGAPVQQQPVQQPVQQPPQIVYASQGANVQQPVQQPVQQQPQIVVVDRTQGQAQQPAQPVQQQPQIVVVDRTKGQAQEPDQSVQQQPQIVVVDRSGGYDEPQYAQPYGYDDPYMQPPQTEPYYAYGGNEQYGDPQSPAVVMPQQWQDANGGVPYGNDSPIDYYRDYMPPYPPYDPYYAPQASPYPPYDPYYPPQASPYPPYDPYYPPQEPQQIIVQAPQAFPPNGVMTTTTTTTIDTTQGVRGNAQMGYAGDYGYADVYVDPNGKY